MKTGIEIRPPRMRWMPWRGGVLFWWPDGWADGKITVWPGCRHLGRAHPYYTHWRRVK